MLANKQNLDHLSERAHSDKKKTLNVDPAVMGRSASDKKGLAPSRLAVAGNLETNRLPSIQSTSHGGRIENFLTRPVKKDSASQTSEQQQNAVKTGVSEADVLNWMYSEEEPSSDYWKQLAVSREQEIRVLVEENEDLRRQIELISNLNKYLMSQIEENEGQSANDSSLGI